MNPSTSIKKITFDEQIAEERIQTQEFIESIKEREQKEASKLIISIVIPLYNEQKTVKGVVSSIPENPYFEIIIVDDGSKDRSVQKIKELRDPRIRIIRHKQNLGYGASILTGLRKAKGDIVVTLDSDGQHNPAEIPKLVFPILKEKADVVIGSRYLGSCHYKLPLHTRLGEKFIKRVLWLFFKTNIRNNQSGFRAFSKRSLEMLRNLKFQGMGLTTEILFKTGSRGLKIAEVPINVYPRKYGSSYVNLIKLIKSIFSCVFVYFMKKFFKDFDKIIYQEEQKYLPPEISYINHILRTKDVMQFTYSSFNR